MGARDRLAFRVRQHGDRGHRQRQRAFATAGKFCPVHPDGRRDQSRQFGRPAFQHARRGCRHQFADLQPHRRLHGLVVCDPDRCRAGDPGPAARQGPGVARPDRRGDPGGDQGTCRLLRPAQAGRRPREPGGKRQPGRQGRRGGPRHHRQIRRQDHRSFERPAAHRRFHAPGRPVERPGPAQGRNQGTHGHRRGTA